MSTSSTPTFHRPAEPAADELDNVLTVTFAEDVMSFPLRLRGRIITLWQPAEVEAVKEIDALGALQQYVDDHDIAEGTEAEIRIDQAAPMIGAVLDSVKALLPLCLEDPSDADEIIALFSDRRVKGALVLMMGLFRNIVDLFNAALGPNVDHGE